MAILIWLASQESITIMILKLIFFLKKLVMNKISLILIVCLISTPVYAYLGPGMGGGVIAAIIGFFAAIFLALWGILYYPIKRALKNRKSKKISENNKKNDT